MLSNLQNGTRNDRMIMNDEMVRMWEEVVVAYIEVVSRNVIEGLRGR
jgi:hypothetical protein